MTSTRAAIQLASLLTWIPFILALPALPGNLPAFSYLCYPRRTVANLDLAVILPEPLTLTNKTRSPAHDLASNYSGYLSLAIENCGIFAPEVERGLRSMDSIANLATLLVVAGSNSPAYRAMFKSDSVQSQVALHFHQIHEYRGSIGLKPTPLQVTAPRVACAAPDSFITYRNLKLGYNPWRRCAAAAHGPPNELFYADGTAYIFICPSFFQKPMAPFGSKCPDVIANLFTGDEMLFYGAYQVYMLLYIFVRWYLQALALDSSSAPVEVFEWNHCINYSDLSSMKNPTNYVLYAARRCCLVGN